MNENQKARIVELAQQCVSFHMTLESVLDDEDYCFTFRALTDASAEAFRIARETVSDQALSAAQL
jgi:hypothetical protein